MEKQTLDLLKRLAKRRKRNEDQNQQGKKSFLEDIDELLRQAKSVIGNQGMND